MKNIMNLYTTIIDTAERFNSKEEVELYLMKVGADVLSNIISNRDAISFDYNNNTTTVVKETEPKIITKTIVDDTRIKELEQEVERLNAINKELLAKAEASITEEVETQEKDGGVIKDIKRRYDKSDVVYGIANINNKDLFFTAGEMNVPLVYGATDLETLAVKDELDKTYPQVLGAGAGDLRKIYTNIDGYPCYINKATSGKILGYIGDYCFFWSPEKSDKPFFSKCSYKFISTGSYKDAVPVSTNHAEDLNLYAIASKLYAQYATPVIEKQTTQFDDVVSNEVTINQIMSALDMNDEL